MGEQQSMSPDYVEPPGFAPDEFVEGETVRWKTCGALLRVWKRSQNSVTMLGEQSPLRIVVYPTPQARALFERVGWGGTREPPEASRDLAGATDSDLPPRQAAG